MREFSIFHLSKPEWDASKIGIKSNGGWAVFTDPITHKSLNSPRNPYPEPKIAYRRKTEEQLEQEEKIRKWREIKYKKKGNNFNNFSTVTNPLLNPPKDNYKEFKARKHIVSSKNSNNDFDEFESYTKGILTSRTMPSRPKKTAQLARDLQVTSLNTQRYSNFSHSTARGCTPRSRETSICYNVSDVILDEYEEEENNDQNECKTLIQQKNESKTEPNDMEKTEITFIGTNDIQNISENSIKNINSNESNDDTQNENKYDIDHEVDKKNNKAVIIDVDVTYDDKVSNIIDEKIEFKEHITMSDNIERIEIKADLIDDVKKDDVYGSISCEAHSETESIEQNESKEELQNQSNNEDDKESNLSYSGIEADIEFQSESNKSNNKSKQWKSKRTGKVVSRKRTIITSCSSFNNQKNNNSNIDLSDNRNKKIIVRSAETYNIPKNNQKEFKHTHPIDKPIHFKFKYNHPNNLRKSDNKPNNEKKITINRKNNQKNMINDQIKSFNKKLNDNTIKEKNKVNITSSLNHQKNKAIHNSDDLIKNDSNRSYNHHHDNKNDINIEILSNETNDPEHNEDSNNENLNANLHNNTSENDPNDNDEVEIDIQINSSTEIISKDNELKNSTRNDISKENEKDQIDSIESTSKNIISDHINASQTLSTSSIPSITSNNNEEEDNNSNKGEDNKNNTNDVNENPDNNNNDIISNNNNKKINNNNKNSTNDIDNTNSTIKSDIDNNDIITIDNTTSKNSDNDNDNTENDTNVKNNINDYEPLNETNNESNIYDYNSDSYDDYNSPNTTSAPSKTTKKAINVYGHNYNDYNYYSNVIQNNAKRNLASSAPFEFTGTTRSGGISSLSTEISHNLSPLPTTRRPATSTRQKFIERPECIGPERFFKGDDPAPARRFFQSANLVAEMRREEELKMLVNANVKRNLSKTVARKGPSLYERSLKPQEKRYCWPRDFAQFSVE